MRKILIVEGMSCAHCEKAVKTALGELPEVKNVEVDLSSKKVIIECEGLVDEKLREAIDDIGYEVVEIN